MIFVDKFTLFCMLCTMCEQAYFVLTGVYCVQASLHCSVCYVLCVGKLMLFCMLCAMCEQTYNVLSGVCYV